MSIPELLQTLPAFAGRSGREISGELLPALKSPEQDLAVIHIAGTNGKGSVSVFLADFLSAGGLRVGRLTSPHLFDLRERIVFDGEMISPEDMEAIGRSVVRTASQMHLATTMSDVLLAIALFYFREKKADAALLETGLGGRLDSTNAIRTVPRVTVLTRIGLDHTRYLGDTVQKIAAEKAAIIKHGTRLVLAADDPAADRVILEKASQEKVPVYRPEKDLPPEVLAVCEEQIRALSFSGTYQEENLKTAAMAALLFLEDVVLPPAEGKLPAEQLSDSCRFLLCQMIQKGAVKFRWPARLQLLSENPPVIVDGAHNPQGAQALCRSLSMRYPGQSFCFVIGMLADKDCEGFFRQIRGLASELILTSFDDPRAASLDTLLSDFKKETDGFFMTQTSETCLVRTADSPAEAAAIAEQEKQTGAGVVFCGSLHFAAEILRICEGKSEGQRI